MFIVFLKLSMLPPWVQLLSCGVMKGEEATDFLLVAKQAVEFPQVLAHAYKHIVAFQFMWLPGSLALPTLYRSYVGRQSESLRLITRYNVHILIQWNL